MITIIKSEPKSIVIEKKETDNYTYKRVWHHALFEHKINSKGHIIKTKVIRSFNKEEGFKKTEKPKKQKPTKMKFTLNEEEVEL